MSKSYTIIRSLEEFDAAREQFNLFDHLGHWFRLILMK
jgi:hypothetical protein